MLGCEPVEKGSGLWLMVVVSGLALTAISSLNTLEPTTRSHAEQQQLLKRARHAC